MKIFTFTLQQELLCLLFHRQLLSTYHVPGTLLDAFEDGSIIQHHKASKTHMKKLRLKAAKSLTQVCQLVRSAIRI